MAYVLDKEYYLMGVYFDEYDNEEQETIFNDWHVQLDLTGGEIKNIRPIPFIPVMANALSQASDKHLWGTDKNGRLMELGLGDNLHDEIKSPLNNKNHNTTSNKTDVTEMVILKHISRVLRLAEENYELTFPPLSLVAQMIGNEPTSGRIIAEGLNEISTTLSPRFKGIDFKPTKILPKQLAPKYKSESLSDEQSRYNQWHDKVTKENKTIEGFVVPSINTCAVVFSNKFYRGAEVSIVRPLKDGSNLKNNEEAEEIIAVADVKIPGLGDEPFDLNDAPNVLPNALFHFNPDEVSDGVYLIRVKFWKDDYFDLNKHELPKSVEKSKLIRDFKKRDRNDREQTVYTYELHEKLTFQSSSGLIKIAHVCGDMISLEELIIHQFPNRLPEYQNYATGGVFFEESSQPGLGSFTLSTEIMKTYDSIASDFVSLNGLKLHGTPGKIAQTIGMAFLESLDEGQVPEVLYSAMAFKEAIAANQDAFKELTKSKILARKNLSPAYLFARGLRKQGLDTSYLARLFNGIDKDYQSNKTGKSKYFSAIARLSGAWSTGRLVSRGVPIITTSIDVKNFLDSYNQKVTMLDSADKIYKHIEEMAESYLKGLAYVKRFQHSKSNADENIKAVQEKLEGLASVEYTSHKVSLNLYFTFNSVEKNTVPVLHNDSNNIQVCNKLREILEENSDYKLIISGHADRVGDFEANLVASKQRAEYVADYILNNASDSKKEDLKNRITVKFFGSAESAINYQFNNQCINKSDAQYCTNDRRVEVQLLMPEYTVSLPSSRTGAMKIEGLYQLWQSYQFKAKKAEDEMSDMAISALTAVGMLTPLYPYFALYFIAETSAGLIDSAVSLLDSLIGTQSYEALKQSFRTKNDVNTLAKINKGILSQYKNVNKNIKAGFSSEKELGEHLNSSVTRDELLKRFLLRCYAINSLVELLVYISTLKGFSKSSIEHYNVDGFIEQYILNDDWVINTATSNTMAENWINYYSLNFGKNVKDSLWLLFDRSKVQGRFSNGFAVHTGLFQDKGEKAIRDLAFDFNLQQQNIKLDDIGFSRVLMYNPHNDKWHPCTSDNNISYKIGPFTRLKVQILLKHEVMSRYKTMFEAKISFYVNGFIFDTNGPMYNVMFREMDLNKLISPDNSLPEYFESQAADKMLGLEFEPTYWFGAYEIPGLKPIYHSSILNGTGVEGFNRWLEGNHHTNLQYGFKLNNKIRVSTNFSIAKSKANSKKNLLIDYGINDKEQQLQLYDGSYMRNVSLKATDLMIYDFVKSNAAESHKNTPPLLSGNIIVQPAIKVNNNWTYFEVKSSVDVSGFDWSKEQATSIYVALLADKRAENEYEKMLLDYNSAQVQMQLGGIKNVIGPTVHATMHYAGKVDVSYDAKVTYPRPGQTFYKRKYKLLLSTKPEELEAELSEFAENVINKLASTGDDDFTFDKELKDSKQKYIYVVKFDLKYISPTGVEINGLRPFGDIIDDDNNIKLSYLSVQSFSQQGLDINYPVTTKSIYLPKADSYFNNKPWIQEKGVSRFGANDYWEKVLKSKTEQEHWVKQWITEQPTTLQAPVPKPKADFF